jgi:hypothetical protein
MSEQKDSSGGFAKAFVPGLVLGLVVGAFAGVTLPPILDGSKLPEPKAGDVTSSRDRDQDLRPGDEDSTLIDDSLIVTPDEGVDPAPTEDPVEPVEDTPPEDGAPAEEDAGPADDTDGDADDGGD